MMKFLAIILSNLILLQSLNIGLEDFSKLNVLLEHAQYHQEKYGDSFVQFLAEHYGTAKDTHKNDHKEHQELPFKDKHQLCSHVTMVYLQNTTIFAFNSQEPIVNSIHFFYKESQSLFEKTAVFQPPKFA